MEAERVVKRAMETLGITETLLATLKKGDESKILIGTLARQRTTVANAWIAKRLHIGGP